MIPKPPEPGENIAGEEDKNSPSGNGPTSVTSVTGKGFSTSNEKYEWWLNELRSLGIAVHQRDEFNDLKEISSLADNLKIITILIPEISHCSD